MADVLDSVLDGTQLPHQSWMAVTDTAASSGLPLLLELLRRSLARSSPTLLIAVLHSPAQLLPKGYAPTISTKVLDLTDSIPGFSSSESYHDVRDRILSACKALGSGVQVFIDALDVLSEDYTPTATLRLIRALLRIVIASKPPSRLIVLLPHTSPFLPHLLPPTLSPSLMLLSSHHPTLLTHLSRTYLTPIEGCPAFWQILERARERRTGDTLAWSGQEGIEISMDWTDCKGAIVQVLVRKAAGGTRAITRNLSALATSASGLKTVPLSELVQVNPMPGPGNGDARGGQRETEMDVPFNLSLTEEQRRRRGEVPLPYAHEGEGVGVGVGLDWDDEDDEDDEEEI